MKSRLIQSAFYSFIVTLYGTCIYYAVGVFLTLSQGGDVVKFFLDTLLAGFILFLFLSFLFYELTGSFEEMNRRRKEGNEDKNNKEDGPKSS